MSSSIEEYFQPPEWATKEEVIKAAQHYINYWKIEARQRNQQWLDALQGADNAKRCEESLRGELNRKHKEFAILQSARERDVAEIHRLKAEVERLTSEVSYDNRVQLHVDKLAGEFTQVEVERLQAEVDRLRKAGDAMQKRLIFLHDRWDSDEPNIESDAWHAAKEGKQP